MSINKYRKTWNLRATADDPITDTNRSDTIGQAVTEFISAAEKDGFDFGNRSTLTISVRGDDMTCCIVSSSTDPFESLRNRSTSKE